VLQWYSLCLNNTIKPAAGLVAMFKLSIILAATLFLTLGAFKLYYDKSEAEKEMLATQLQQAMNNQLLLENSIAKQNQQITEQLNKEKETQQQIASLTEKNNEAQLEVNRLKNTFAKHDLNMLSMAKPKLIERIINRGTAKVGKELETLTEPNQFDEEIITDNVNTN
jgi:septal ring factor EnvC (AmiA/AmiB activator)|tara:strand:- start:447 stop:947 length:501 start_codon:yes stop_codon:yes gene_type:complete